MKKITVLFAIFGLLILLVADLANSQTPAAAKFQYVGVAKCKPCHNSPNKGAQFKIWSESEHAQAYTVLASEEAKKIAKAKGIANPQKDDKCLKCHVTGHGQPATMFDAAFKIEDGIGCETCHGPGSVYKNMKTMKDLYAGTQDAKAVGFIVPKEADCKKCHNLESPTYKEFKFTEAWKKIAHNIPK